MKYERARTWTILVLVIACGAHSSDWPQWRGPQRNGFSEEKGLTARAPALKWEAAVRSGGRGMSHDYNGSVAICGGRVFVVAQQDETPNRNEALWAFDLATGKLLWKHPLRANPADIDANASGNSTPCAEGGLVWAAGQMGEVLCCDAASGKEVWHAALPRPSKPDCDNLGNSPLLFNDLLIACNFKGYAAFDKKTGQARWKWPGESETYGALESSSAVVGKFGGRDVLVFTGYTTRKWRNQYEPGTKEQPTFIEAEALFGVDPTNGKTLFMEKLVGEMNTPLVLNGLVFATRVVPEKATGSMYGTFFTLLALKCEPSGKEAWTVAEAWRAKWHSSNRRCVFSPATDGQRIFFAREGIGLDCYEAATGKELWVGKAGYIHHDSGSVSPIVADGKVFSFESESGKLFCLNAADGKPLWQLDAFAKDEGKYAAPALADGCLVLRGGKSLKCFSLKP